MLMVAYLLALMVHGPWDNWMGLLSILAIADLVFAVAELGLRVIATVMGYYALAD